MTSGLLASDLIERIPAAMELIRGGGLRLCRCLVRGLAPGYGAEPLLEG